MDRKRFPTIGLPFHFLRLIEYRFVTRVGFIDSEVVGMVVVEDGRPKRFINFLAAELQRHIFQLIRSSLPRNYDFRLRFAFDLQILRQMPLHS